MIHALTGTLVEISAARVALQCGPVTFELLVPAADIEPYRALLGRELTLHTLVYLEGDPNRGNLEPRLLGFRSKTDREFFELFTTVKGVGPKTALRALVEPIEQIAAWIENRDTRALQRLDGIGKRTAELMVAELSGKAGRYAGVTPADPTTARPAARAVEIDESAEAALTVLTSPQMGLRRAEAEALLERVRRSSPRPLSADALLAAMLRLHAAGRA